MTNITVKNVTKILKGYRVLDDISISLDQPLCYGFVGRNGAGKTMLFRAIRLRGLFILMGSFWERKSRFRRRWG